MRVEWERAARAGDLTTLLRMIDEGADIDAKDSHGQTALMLVSMLGHHDAARQLVSRGAGLDHTAKFRLSALMLAVVNNHADIVELLVSAGANRALCGSGAPGFHDKTALDLARGRESAEMVAILSR